MSICPKCDRKLGRKRGKEIIHKATKYRPEIRAYEVIWICPVHGETKSKAELMVMGELNRVMKSVTK